MNTQNRTLLETRTMLAPADVLEAAKEFFTRRNSIYAAFLEQESSRHVTFRGQGGEEIVLAVDAVEGATRVTGASYLFDAQVSRFFAVLPPAASEVAV